MFKIGRGESIEHIEKRHTNRSALLWQCQGGALAAHGFEVGAIGDDRLWYFVPGPDIF